MAAPEENSTISPVQEPIVDGFGIEAKRIKGLEEVFNKVSALNFLEIASEGETLVLLNIENRDIQKNPYLFSIIYLAKDRFKVTYTVSPGMSPKKRRLSILKYFLSLLTLLEDCYDINSPQLFQLIERTIEEMGEYVSSTYEEVYAKYDNLRTELNVMQKKAADLALANEHLSKVNLELKSKNDELKIKVQQLETLSDDILILKIQEWLAEHRSEINISDFARVHKVKESRIEQVLNRMITEGYLEIRE